MIYSAYHFWWHLLHSLLLFFHPSSIRKGADKQIECIHSGLESLEMCSRHGSRKEIMIDWHAAPPMRSFGHQEWIYRMTADSHDLVGRRWQASTSSAHMNSDLCNIQQLHKYSFIFAPHTFFWATLDCTNLRRSLPHLGCFTHMLRHAPRISHHAHMLPRQLSEYSTLSPHMLQNIHKTFAELWTIIPSLSHHFRHTVPCLWIFILHEAHFTPNIRYYSHIPCRLFIGSSRTFRHRLTHFPSVPNTLVDISEHFYCTKLCTGTYSGIHPPPSIQPLCSHLLKVSISLRSIIDHSTPLFPFSESIGTYSSLIYSFLFLSPFVFLLLSSHFLHVSCFGSLSFYSYLLHFLFRLFSSICMFMYL